MSSAAGSNAVEDPDPPLRGAIEFLLISAILATLLCLFVAQPYFVPSGSMAPVLLGLHLDSHCDTCGANFAVGVDRDGRPAVDYTTCPRCRAFVSLTGLPVSGGDQVLVRKGSFDFSPPRRWELAVFRGPDDPRESFVKRVIGLPGESIEIRRGDVYVNGSLAVKTLNQFWASAIAVFDQHWQNQPMPERMLPTGETESWLTLRDEKGRETPVRDFVAYNAGGDTWERENVRDLALEAMLKFDDPKKGGRGSLFLSVLAPRPIELKVEFDPSVGSDGTTPTARWSLSVEGQVLRQTSQRFNPISTKVFMALVDGRIHVRCNGEPLFEDLDLPAPLLEADIAPIERPFVTRGRGFHWSDVKLHRDVFYTSRIRDGSGAAIGKAFQLADDEFFMMGDNSAISHDSRGWDRPAVNRLQLVGRPFFVHWPLKNWKPPLWPYSIQTLDWPNVRRLR